VSNKITFSWWNTSLSPHTKENLSSDEHKAFVLVTLWRLINEKSVDVICLCEVSTADVEYISGMFNGSEFSIYDGTVYDGRKRYDICTIYKSNLLQIINTDLITKIQPDGKIHAAQELNFQIKEFQEPITLYVAHWVSRLHVSEDDTLRIQLGTLLMDAVSASIEQRNIENIVILGDFNDEPFNKSLTEALFSTKDTFLVKKKPRLLYNPFWRLMVNKDLHPCTTELWGGGTYYHKNNKTSRWKTFDQIIFSSSFLRGNTWYLNEEKTEVYYNKEIIRLITNTNSKLDHLPVISSIERY